MVWTYGRFDDLIEPAPASSHDRLQILQCALCLCLYPALDDFPRRRFDGDAPRYEGELADDDGLRVWADGGGRIWERSQSFLIIQFNE